MTNRVLVIGVVRRPTECRRLSDGSCRGAAGDYGLLVRGGGIVQATEFVWCHTQHLALIIYRPPGSGPLVLLEPATEIARIKPVRPHDNSL